MRRTINRAAVEKPRFLSVAQVAALLGCSPMTIYREIQLGQFPAVRVRGRYVVPARAVDEMESAAMGEQTLVDAADFAPEGVA